MNVRNCRKCRRLFNYVMGAQLCNSCRQELEEKFQEVKKYVRENPGSGIHEVSEACDVPIKQIQQWVREERLVFSEDSIAGIDCERCGKMIRSGKYCPECKAALTSSMNEAIAKKGPAPLPKKQAASGSSEKMRFLDSQR